MSKGTHVYYRGRGYAIENSPYAVSPMTRLQALAQLPAIVYAVKVGDLIKIGHSRSFALRFRSYGPAAEVLGFRPGTLVDERNAHQSLRPHRAAGREWYHPTSEVLAFVNEMRADLNLEPLAA